MSTNLVALRRLFAAGLFAAVAVAATATPAHAGDTGPVIVIPSRPGVPVIINGVDASYAVVEGDWGLARPGHMAITVIGGRPVLPNPVYTQRNSYHPRYGYPPPRGRFEIEPPPNSPLPEPAETYSRTWSTTSAPPPASNFASPTIVDPKTFQQPLVVTPPGRRR